MQQRSQVRTRDIGITCRFNFQARNVKHITFVGYCLNTKACLFYHKETCHLNSISVEFVKCFSIYCSDYFLVLVFVVPLNGTAKQSYIYCDIRGDIVRCSIFICKDKMFLYYFFDFRDQVTSVPISENLLLLQFNTES